MKHTNLLLVIFTLFVSVSACKKGDTGPEGPKGNADIMMYQFGSTTFTSAVNLTLSNLTPGKVDSSMILAYYNPVPEATSAWYPIPGSGSGGAYETRFFLYQPVTPSTTYNFGLRTIKPDGTGPYGIAVTFRKIKILFAPASSILAGGRGSQPAVDLNDYHAVMRHLNLPE